MPETNCAACGGGGWLFCDGYGRVTYCPCAAGNRLRIEDDYEAYLDNLDNVDESESIIEDVAAANGYRSVREFNDAFLDESESIHERSERRADEVTRWDGGER